MTKKHTLCLLHATINSPQFNANGAGVNVAVLKEHKTNITYEKKLIRVPYLAAEKYLSARS